LGRSLENLSKALELNPNALEALFNRALSRQYLRLYTQAETDWREYLKRDQNSQWSNEARQNLKLIEDDYTVALSSKGVALFTAKSNPVKYYIAIESDSSFD
jgi:tetratricopeptide (TPR) repeat protein